MANTPQSLHTSYYSYKEKTKYALGWLGTTGHPHTSLKSTLDVLKAAEKVRSNAYIVPKSVISALSEAIAKRWRVWEIYQSLRDVSDDGDANDHKHKAFIKRYVKVLILAWSNSDKTRLEDVLRILQPLEAKVMPTASVPQSSLGTACSKSASNRFATFNDVDFLYKAEENAVDSENTKFTNVESNISNPSLQPSLQDVPLQDDDIGEWIELSFYLYVSFYVYIFWTPRGT